MQYTVQCTTKLVFSLRDLKWRLHSTLTQERKVTNLSTTVIHRMKRKEIDGVGNIGSTVSDFENLTKIRMN